MTKRIVKLHSMGYIIRTKALRILVMKFLPLLPELLWRELVTRPRSSIGSYFTPLFPIKETGLAKLIALA